MTQRKRLLITALAFLIPVVLLLKFYRPDPLGGSTQEFASYLRQGGSLQGKTVWIRAEWNLGDTMQFLRYAQQLKKMGATIVFEPQKPLCPLSSLCPYIDSIMEKSKLGQTVDRISCLCPCVGTVLPKQKPNEHIDFVVSLARLPAVFDSLPGFKANPSEQYLYADPGLVEHWKQKLSYNDKPLKIGICWFGDSRHNPERFIPLHQLSQLGKIEGVQLYSLQKYHGLAQLEEHCDDVKIIDFGQKFDQKHGSFMDTAAIMKNLDLILTVDTSVAHLAGGLGVPVWTLLPHEPEWRWVKDKRSAWNPNYSSMRLFIQPEPGDWETVMNAITQEIRKKLKETA